MIRDLLTELRRRHVYRVAVAYAVVGWLLIEVATQVFPVFHMPDWAAQLVVLLIALGFPIALVLAWAFEVTPEGVRRTEPVDSDAARAPEHHRKVGRTLNAIIMTILGLALVLALWRPWATGSGVSTPDASTASARSAAGPAKASSGRAMPHTIAVLPFANLSGDKSQQYFSDGISEDLLNLLARIPQLQVTARSSSFWFRDKGYTIPQIAGKLHVAYILEGSVQKVGHDVRISVQLVDASSDTQRWSQTYDRRLKDVFRIQDEIGADVVRNLRLRLLGQPPRVSRVDLQAYMPYQQARQLTYQGTSKALERSNALYRQALAVDPRYTAAWIGLAKNAINTPWLTNSQWRQGFDQARRYILKAQAIDPDNAEVQSVLAYLLMFGKFDFHAAARHLDKALAKDPDNADVLLASGQLLFLLDRPDRAMATFQRALQHDPVNPDIYLNIAEVMIQQNRLKEAIPVLRKAQELSPSSGVYPSMIGWVEMGLGHPEAALKALKHEDTGSIGLPSIYCALGRRAEALKMLDAWSRKYASQTAAGIASGYADCGELDKAFALLDQSVGQISRVIPYTVYGISFRKYHGDPRWKAYLRKIGFAPDQLAKVRFAVPPADRGARDVTTSTH